jgi:predicted nucleic acid-binding protein
MNGINADQRVIVHYDELGAVSAMAEQLCYANNIWIAAAVLHYSLTLATRGNHFGEVEGLRLADWTAETAPGGT